MRCSRSLDCASDLTAQSLAASDDGRSGSWPLPSPRSAGAFWSDPCSGRLESVAFPREQLQEKGWLDFVHPEDAANLGLSTKTVEGHKYEMMETLGITSTAELVRYALDRRLNVD